MADQLCNFYLFNTAVVTVATGTTSSPTIQVGNEYDLELTSLHAVIRKAADTTGEVNVVIKLSGGQNLTENALNLYMIAQTAGAQGEMTGEAIRIPWAGAILPANTRVTFEITSAAGADVFVQLCFVGRKIWKVNM